MGWIKLLCSLVVMGCSVSFGCSMQARLKLRVQRLEEAIRFLQLLSEEIRYTAEPISQVVAHHSGDSPLLEHCSAAMKKGLSFAEGWAQGIEQISVFTKEDCTCLLSFGNQFGYLDSEGQIGVCRLTQTQLLQQLQQAEEDVLKKARLFRSLGVLCGAAILLVIV